MAFTGDDAHITKRTLNILSAFAEFEKERQREGIALAKMAGVYKGRKPASTPNGVKELHTRVEAGEKRAALAQ